MSKEGATDYGVRVWLDDGTTEPKFTEDIHWVSLNIANRIASKLWEARQNVVNSQVTAIEIIDADYNTVQKHCFEEEED